MERVHNQLVKRLETAAPAVPTAAGVSGGETAASGVDLGTSLLLGASGPATASLLITEPATTSTSTSSPTPDTSSTSSSSSHSSSVSTGSVVGIIVAVFLILIGAMFVIYTYIKKRTTSRARHPLSRGPSAVRGTESLRDHGKDKQRNDSEGRGEGKNNPPPGVVRGKSPDSGKFGLFEKDPSIRSVTDEKANISDDFDPSTMATFAKYQANPADDLSTLPHPRPLAGREEGSPAVSWDGKTVISDPFRSLHASVSDNMSPTSVIARQTPQATDSAQHRWESAEVVMMDEPTTETLSVYSDADASQNPFNDDSAPRGSIGGNDSDTRNTGNPFFNASQHNPFAERSTRSRASSVSTAKRSRSYSISSRATVRAGESENALFSLLAALDNAPAVPDEQANRSSMQTTTTSIYPPTEGGVKPETPQAF